MKKVMFFSFVILVLSQACGQKKIPDNVIAAFNSKFVNATKVKWDKENNKEWEAEFKLNGKTYSANFSNEGQWLETEYEIENFNIPKKVQETLNTFKGFGIKKGEVSETNNGINYEFILKGKVEKIEVVVDALGNILQKESINREEDND